MLEQMLEKTAWIFNTCFIRTCQPAACVWELGFQEIISAHRDEVTGDWRRLYDVDLNELYNLSIFFCWSNPDARE